MKRTLFMLLILVATMVLVTSANAQWLRWQYGLADLIEGGRNLSNGGGIVFIGANDLSTCSHQGTQHQLAFGAGNASGNEGLWSMNAKNGGFRFGRAWNMPLTVTGINNWGTSAFTINCNGTVGINLPNPFNSDLHNSGNRTDVRLRVEGSTLTSTVYLTSDKRHKNDVEPINNLQNLFSLEAVQYTPSSEAYREMLETFKENRKGKIPERDFELAVSSFEKRITELDEDTSLHFGFIAQDLQKIFPNLVIEDDDGFLAVNYTGLIPVMLDAIKEQQKQINYLLEREKGKGSGTDAFINDAMLYQNNPNPFSQHTEIKFYVSEQSRNAFICIYDMTGKEVMKLDIMGRGYSSVTLNANQLQAGMYMYSLIVDGREIDTKRMILTNN